MSVWVKIERASAEAPVKAAGRGQAVAKRAMDICLCLLTLPFALIMGLLAAVAIRLESPGPVFFVHERIGRNGQPFKMYKFRTMHHNIDRVAHREFMQAFVRGSSEKLAGKSVFKPFENKQITRTGAILRKTSLDELPQILNILRGEMSLVGPRPNVTWEVEAYKSWHMERLNALPGITGLAQVRGRSGIPFDEIVRHDIEYIERQSIWLDLRILWMTVSSVLLGKGAE